MDRRGLTKKNTHSSWQVRPSACVVCMHTENDELSYPIAIASEKLTPVSCLVSICINFADNFGVVTESVMVLHMNCKTPTPLVLERRNETKDHFSLMCAGISRHEGQSPNHASPLGPYPGQGHNSMNIQAYLSCPGG